MLSYLFVAATIASVLFTVRGLLARSWVLLWFAALCSYVASVLSGFSIGGAVFLTPCLQLALVLIVGGVAPRRSALLVMLLSALIWFMLVPFQIYGVAWLGGFGIYSLVGLLALLATLLLYISRYRFAAISN